MAVISSTDNKAEVQAVGSAMSAKVNFSGALMEMLATVYVHILLAAIREAVQNACDAAKRAGLSFADGVMVTLPTPDNNQVEVADRGAGMTHAFMTDFYLSFGSSTKNGDDGAAGGLGVGRWAAYGYIRECYIATTAQDPDFSAEIREIHRKVCFDGVSKVEFVGTTWARNPEDGERSLDELLSLISPVVECELIERTYFQHQGSAGTPMVTLAFLSPGKQTGTRVWFPVKDSDGDEAIYIVAWLKEVMALSMGDSFSVDTPCRLPETLPPVSGVVFNLEEESPALKGIRVFPLQGANLQYNRGALKQGSLVVLTNQAEGVGGLPFHVQAAAGSVFHKGMLIEIPMSYRLSFVPSREELKYTDEFNELMQAIDTATKSMFLKLVTHLRTAGTLKGMQTLENLLGNNVSWHALADANNYVATAKWDEPLHKDLMARLSSRWLGLAPAATIEEFRDVGVSLKWRSPSGSSMQTVSAGWDRLYVTLEGKLFPLSFHVHNPPTLILNTLKTGGLQRAREYASTHKSKNFLFIAASDINKAREACSAYNAHYDNMLEVVETGALPAPPKVVVPKGAAKPAALLYYCRRAEKQQTVQEQLDQLPRGLTTRYYVVRDGSKLRDFNDDVTLGAIQSSWEGVGIEKLMEAVDTDRLYLLTPKQADALDAAIQSLRDAELWDAEESEVAEMDDGAAVLARIRALKAWRPAKHLVEQVLASPAIQGILSGSRIVRVMPSYQLVAACKTLASASTEFQSLIGTKLDAALFEYVDLLQRKTKLHTEGNLKLEALRDSLIRVGLKLADTALQAQLHNLKGKGTIDYSKKWEELAAKFPLFGVVTWNSTLTKANCRDISDALAFLYK